MKNLFYLILSALVLFSACSSDDNVNSGGESFIPKETIFEETKSFKVIGGGAWLSIVYDDRIGTDFDSALESLIKEKEQILNVLITEGHYSGEGYYIEKEKMVVDFKYDDREFFVLTIIDKANIYQYLFTSIVIDSKGNHYYAQWCED